jgi:peptide-methionine (R)-S-oxide reductase
MVDSKDGDEVGSDHGDAFWREKLTDDEYAVLRNKGTERAFTGEYWDVFDDGTYHCRGCGEALFTAESKFDSGCGWPSFDRALSQEAVAEARDTSHGMIRTEILCKSCGGHLGHVFPDGPTDTGLRYCVNSLSVRLESDAD